MNENSFCICCYNENTNFVNKCEFDDHKICTKCNKEYVLKFNKIGCMFCNPFENIKTKLPTRNINIILCANFIICIFIIIMLYMLLLFISSIMLLVKEKCQQLI